MSTKKILCSAAKILARNPRLVGDHFETFGSQMAHGKKNNNKKNNFFRLRQDTRAKPKTSELARRLEEHRVSSF